MKDKGPETIDEYIAWCRSGKPQQLMRKPPNQPQKRTNNLTQCSKCGGRCHERADRLCAKCRASKKQREKHGLVDCVECGRKCRRNPDGICRFCRKKRKKGQHHEPDQR